MKTGKTLIELAHELERRKDAAEDYISDTRQVSMQKGALVLDAVETPQGPPRFPLTRHASRQVGQRLQIPATYWDRLAEKHPDLLDHSVTELLHREPERRMVRTLDGEARAFLSDRYRRFDNHQLAEIVVPVLGEQPDMRVESAEITAARMYIKAVFPRVQRDVKVGDPVQAGVVISNSEIGSGSTKVELLVFRLVCSNGMIQADNSTRRHHVGRAANGDSEAYQLYQDDTLRADDRAFALKLRDTVRAITNGAALEAAVEQMQEATRQIVEGSPIKAVERLASSAKLTEGESEGVLQQLIQGGDLSRYGLVNAVTRHSQDIDDYDRATELERLGGEILVGSSMWDAVRAAS
jgi:hypothetical protein